MKKALLDVLYASDKRMKVLLLLKENQETKEALKFLIPPDWHYFPR